MTRYLMVIGDTIRQLADEKKLMDLYNQLGISKTATLGEIKTAYRRLALVHHPDKQPPNTSDEARAAAVQTFQQIGIAYTVLSDTQKRQAYDRAGTVQEGLVMDGDELTRFFEELYTKLDADMAKQFAQEYRGSEEERHDIYEAYKKTKGHPARLYDHVHVIHPLEDDDRVHQLVLDGIAAGELPNYRAFTKESAAAKKKRLNKAEKEAKEAEQVLREMTTKESDGDMALTQMLKDRHATRMDALVEQLETKYNGKRKKTTEPTDAEFEAIQRKLKVK